MAKVLFTLPTCISIRAPACFHIKLTDLFTLSYPSVSFEAFNPQYISIWHGQRIRTALSQRSRGTKREDGWSSQSCHTGRKNDRELTEREREFGVCVRERERSTRTKPSKILFAGERFPHKNFSGGPTSKKKRHCDICFEMNSSLQLASGRQ